MSRAAVVKFCQQVTQTPELRTRLKSGVKSGAGWELLVTIGQEHGFDFTRNEAVECFEHERKRRATRESAGHAETHILKQSPILDPRVAETFILREGTGGKVASEHADPLNLKSLRRIALSHDWNLESSPTAVEDDESIFT